MKTTFLFLFSILFYLGSFGQQQPASDVASIKLPNTAQKVNKEEAKSFFGKRSMHSEVSSLKSENFYILDGVFMAFWDTKTSPIDHRSLSQVKSEALALYKLDNSVVMDEASIKTINGHAFLILNYHRGTTYYYGFFSYNESHQAAINGLVQSDLSSNKTAKKIFGEILDNLTFK